ncbi:hypothetical protein TSUD_342020 [Trifolium subterraneum]|nr:hypothetical protein TSUD_342020 [Trifolium subterraneum]
MLPLSLLKTAQGHPMLVELKNGETYNGHLVNCDTWMNIHLREVICTSKVIDKVQEETKSRTDRKPPGVGRGRGRGGGREEGAGSGAGGRQPKGIGRGFDDGGARGAGGRGRGNQGGKPGGSRGKP